MGMNEDIQEGRMAYGAVLKACKDRSEVDPDILSAGILAGWHEAGDVGPIDFVEAAASRPDMHPALSAAFSAFCRANAPSGVDVILDPSISEGAADPITGVQKAYAIAAYFSWADGFLLLRPDENGGASLGTRAIQLSYIPRMKRRGFVAQGWLLSGMLSRYEPRPAATMTVLIVGRDVHLSAVAPAGGRGFVVDMRDGVAGPVHAIDDTWARLSATDFRAPTMEAAS